ncbi:MAG: O-antigen ligase family protein [Bacteroidetes bacterium]|nr:O-antigen ligase family protein [Bacteroidota bacterium]
MLQLVKNKDTYGLGLLLLLTILIGYQELIAPAIGIFVLLTLGEIFIAKSLRFEWNKNNLFFVALYLFYLAGLLWSDHRDIGWKLIEYKMSFFIFPALFLFKKKSTNYWLVLQGLILGSLLLAGRILYLHYITMPQFNEYEIANEVLKIHPTYACIYFTTTLFFIGYAKVSGSFRVHTLIVVVLSLLFIYLVYKLGSFAGMLFLGLVSIVVLAWWVYRKLRLAGVIALLILAPALFIYGILKMDRFAYDVEMTKAVYTEISKGKTYYFEKNREDNSGTKMRVLLWILSTEIILENPMGVGTGDIDFSLIEKCDQYNLELLKEKNLNPHNQFLQTGIDIGIPGILILLGIIGFGFRKGIRTKNYLLVYLVMSLSFNALFESVLQKQSGIVFYSFLICLVTSLNSPGVKSEQDELGTGRVS